MRVDTLALSVVPVSASTVPPNRKPASVVLRTRDDSSSRGGGIPISPIGVGTIGWGDASRGFGTTFREKDAFDAFQRARKSGINFFDTAEVYGYKGQKYEQSAEEILGRFVAKKNDDDVKNDDSDEVVVGSKVFTIPWTNALMGGGIRLGKESLIKAGKESVKRMGGRQMDVWSIHFPFPSFSQDALMSALEESLDLGLTRAVGVSNYNVEQLERAFEILEKRGIPLASNQIEYSVVNRKAEKEGLIQSCLDRDVKVVAHSPLKALKTTEIEEKYVIMNKLCEFIGQVNGGGKSKVSVMLNYCMAKGTIPIPGVKRVEHIEDIENAMGWTLDEESVLTIDEKMDYLDKL